MSRLCVKNLPKYVEEERLREFFSLKGEVTDAKLMRTKEGKSRRFAFIGFRSEQDAEEAIKFYNNSFLDTCRITCEVAHKVGDPNIPRPWSQYSSKDSQSNVNDIKVEEQKDKSTVLPETKIDDSKIPLSKDAQLQEFLQIMQPRLKSKIWANDTMASSLFDDKRSSEIVSESKEQRNLVGKQENETSEDLTEEKTQEVMQDDAISDMDYLQSRIKKRWSDSEDDVEDNNDRDEIKETIIEGNEAKSMEKVNYEINVKDGDYDEMTSNTGRLFVRNLAFTAVEEDLTEPFSKYGDVSQVHIVLDKETKQSKGIAYVHFKKMESAARALEELDNSIFQGRLLHVMHAKPQNPSIENKPSNNPLSLKKKREEQKKASEASGDTRAWNSLFVRQDTVVENIARKYGIDKSDVLDKEADDVAVRIALAETHAITETKKALKSFGVNVSALEEFVSRKGDVQRSNHVILVKNLPYSSSEDDLSRIFGRFGSLDRIILPPTKTLALIIFLEAADARAAFKGLAYKRYKDGPLYLEWAPGNILSSKPVSTTDIQVHAVGKEEVTRAVLKQTLEQVPETEIDPERTESRSIFVKNLNFRTSDEDLQNHFVRNIKKGAVQSAQVKKHMKKGKKLSMGYGFIEFDSVETATDVISRLQGTVLDGHALILQLCHAKKSDPNLRTDERDKSSTKLIVRNVAFEATEKELRQLFSSFGQVKRLRLPKRVDNHRGFAFVEYVTKQETENAMRTLSSTHLYGRRLVIERAKEGETLEELRERTAAQSAAGMQVGGAAKKKSTKRKRNHAEEDDIF